MRPLNVVLGHHSPTEAEILAQLLRPEFRNLGVAHSPAEIRSAVARLRAPVALVDLELVSYTELRQLCRDFPATAFVAIHRLADDQMWSNTLAAGGVDCCQSNDIQSILYSADRSASVHSRVAVA